METSAGRRRRGRGAAVGRATALLLALAVLGPALGACTRASDASTIEADEDVVFFPGFAAEAGPGAWTAHVHGWIFERGAGPVERGLLERLLREKFQLSEAQMQAPLFRERTAMFLVDNERRKTLSVSLSGRTQVLAPSKANGHFEDRLALVEPAARSGDWIELRALTRPGEARTFSGRIQLIGRRGVSVVSDIDDTIKISNVLDRRELVANTFVREFRPAPGMAELYGRWAGSGGAVAGGGDVVFHYVSGSPWQLYPALAEFVRRHGFPAGSFHLRPFRLKDRSAVEFLENRTREYKLGVIAPLIDRFPERRFVLVGDSGETDPEVYAELARRFPDRVRAILIRDVRNQDLTSPRFAGLYADVPPRVVRRVFRDVAELADFRP